MSITWNPLFFFFPQANASAGASATKPLTVSYPTIAPAQYTYPTVASGVTSVVVPAVSSNLAAAYKTRTLSWYILNGLN